MIVSDLTEEFRWQMGKSKQHNTYIDSRIYILQAVQTQIPLDIKLATVEIMQTAHGHVSH